MLQVTLGEKTYTVPYVSAIALREIARPMAILSREETPHPSPSATPSEASRPGLTENQPKGGFSGRCGPPQGEGRTPADAGADLDVLVNWFCLMFGDQFTPDDVYRHYPADRLITDIALSVLAVQQRVSGALTAFPTTPAAEEAKKGRK